MFYDLNIRSKGRDRDRQLLLKRSLELGWSCIAWNTILTGKLSSQNIAPAPPIELEVAQLKDVLKQRSLVDSKLILGTTDQIGLKIRQMNRLSIIIDDVAEAQSLTVGNELIRQYDIIAVTPGNAKVFAFLCKTADVDIISLDFSRKIPFQLNKKMIDEATRRGIYFELCYSIMLGCPSSRREMMSSSRTLVQYLRGRNILFSSGGDTANQLRGPADVMNVANILGLHNENAFNSIAKSSALVLKHACCRKLRYLPNEIITAEEFHLRWPELKIPDHEKNVESSSPSRKRARIMRADNDDDDYHIDDNEAQELESHNEPTDSLTRVDIQIQEGVGDDDYLAF